MLAILEPSDHAWIAAIVFIFAGAAVSARSVFRKPDAARLRILEGKIDLILAHLGLEYNDPVVPGDLSAEVKALADDPTKKIQAIALYREQTGAGLKDAKDAVEAYLAGRR